MLGGGVTAPNYEGRVPITSNGCATKRLPRRCSAGRRPADGAPHRMSGVTVGPGCRCRRRCPCGSGGVTSRVNSRRGINSSGQRSCCCCCCCCCHGSTTRPANCWSSPPVCSAAAATPRCWTWRGRWGQRWRGWLGVQFTCCHCNHCCNYCFRCGGRRQQRSGGWTASVLPLHDGSGDCRGGGGCSAERSRGGGRACATPRPTPLRRRPCHLVRRSCGTSSHRACCLGHQGRRESCCWLSCGRQIRCFPYGSSCNSRPHPHGYVRIRVRVHRRRVRQPRQHGPKGQARHH